MKRITKKSYVKEEGGKKFLFIEKPDREEPSKTEIVKPLYYDNEESIKVLTDMVENGENDAAKLFNYAIINAKNIKGFDDNTREIWGDNFDHEYDEETLLKHESLVNELTHANNVIATHKKQVGDYLFELQYQSHLNRFKENVESDLPHYELRKQFDKFYKHDFTNEDVDMMIKLFSK